VDFADFVIAIFSDLTHSPERAALFCTSVLLHADVAVAEKATNGSN
jgi:hypothetical protein